jgi:hypothetical protein
MSEDIGIPFQPYYCEENAWRLCGHPRFGVYPRRVLFISSPARSVAFAGQRAAPVGEWVVWDYHAVFMVKDEQWQVWDPDCRSGMTTPLGEWLEASFPTAHPVPPELRPWFRAIEGDAFMRAFRSDRGHMRNLDGEWLHPPPPWPAPSDTSNLMRIIDLSDDFLGQVHGLKDLRGVYLQGD